MGPSLGLANTHSALVGYLQNHQQSKTGTLGVYWLPLMVAIT